MSSIAAREVAKEVLETVRAGKRPVLGQILIRKGYSKITATVPTQVTNTRSYKEVMLPAVRAMETERNRLIQFLSTKNLKRERYRDMIDGIDKLTKNIQLLTGGRTGDETFILNWEK